MLQRKDSSWRFQFTGVKCAAFSTMMEFKLESKNEQSRNAEGKFNVHMKSSEGSLFSLLISIHICCIN